MSSKPQKLGNGWYSTTDQTGRTFYINKKTDKRQWEFPEGVPKPEAAGAPQPRAIGKGWFAVDDPSTGKTFYANKELEKRQWDWPEGVPRDGAMPPPPAEDPEDDAGRADRLKNMVNQVKDIRVTEDTLDAARMRYGPGHMVGRFGKVNVKNVIDESVDGNWDFAFEDYARSNFDVKAGSSYFGASSASLFGSSKITLQSLSEFSPKILKQGLLKRTNATPKDKEDAKQMSKNIISYSGDRKTGKPKVDHALKILRFALQQFHESKQAGTAEGPNTAFPVLWDEIYCQLIKQTTNNTALKKENGSPESLVNGFELFTLCAGTFKCTHALYQYIMSHLDRAKRGKLKVAGDGECKAAAVARIRILARRAQVRLRKTQQMKQRLKVPTVMEIAAVLAAKPLMLRVYMVDMTYKTLPVNTHTTARTLCRMMAMVLGAKNDSIYGLYESAYGNQKRFLPDDTRVLDVVAEWQRTADEKQDKTALRAGDHSARFVFEVHYFLDSMTEDDVAGNTLLYIQAVANVVRAQKYPLTKKGSMDLGALQLQIENGDFADPARLTEMVQGHLHRYIAARFIDDTAERALVVDHLVQRWQKMHALGFNAYEYQLTYLDMLRPSIWYGTQKYRVKSIAGSGEYPSGGVWLEVSSRHILVVDCDSSDILETILMVNIMAFGSKDTTLLFKVGNIVYQEKKCFITEMPGAADEITDMIRIYQSDKKEQADEAGLLAGGDNQHRLAPKE